MDLIGFEFSGRKLLYKQSAPAALAEADCYVSFDPIIHRG